MYKHAVLPVNYSKTPANTTPQMTKLRILGPNAVTSKPIPKPNLKSHRSPKPTNIY